MINQISFDLWLTLIRSNPEYKNQKALYLSKILGEEIGYQFTQEQCLTAIRIIGKAGDFQAEYLNANPMPLQLIHNLVVFLTHDPKSTSLTLLEKIQKGFNKLILEYCPILYSETTKSTLVKIHFSGYLLNIASNTGFTDGGTMNMILNKLGIGQYFIKKVYSEQVGASKPSHYFFEYVPLQDIHVSEILHVGDNPVADIKGAEKVGFQTFLINSNDKKIEDLLPFLGINY